MKVRVDRALCIGAANCVGIAPAVFKMDKENKAIVLDPKGADDDTVLNAAEACPTQAIVLEDDTGNQIYP
ncbi:MAG: ferredoxin [Nitrospirae bacterium]|nr:ferredoxin [Nitrospirota bacterium]